MEKHLHHTQEKSLYIDADGELNLEQFALFHRQSGTIILEGK